MGMFAKLGRMLTRTKKLRNEPEDMLVTQLRRCLSTFDITLIGISSTLGSGVYILTGEVSSKTGVSILIAITLAAIASILCGLCYTEFAARVPKAGSAYVYSYVVLGEFFAFVVGWNLILEYGIGAASVIKGFTTYVDAMTHMKIKNFTISNIGQPKLFGSEIYLDFFSLFVSLATTVAVALSVKISSFLNSFCTIVNIIVIVMVISMGSFYAKVENINHFFPDAHLIINGASSCFFAFIGFDAVCMVAEEAKKPNKSIPISVITTILTCYVGFVGAALVLNMMIPHSEMKGSAVLATAFDIVGLHPGKYIISIGAIFGLLGNAIASMMMMPRFLYSMAQDGLIFSVFARVHQRTNIPLFSTIFGGLLTGLMTLFLELHALVEMVSIGTILAYTLVTISVLVLRYRPENLGMVRSRSSRLSGISFSYDGTISIDPRVLKEEEDEDNEEEINRDHDFTASSDGEGNIARPKSSNNCDKKDDETNQSNISDTEHLITSNDSEIKHLLNSLVFASLRGQQNSLLAFPTKASEFVVLVCSLLVVLEILALSAVLHFLTHRLFQGHLAVLLVFIILLVCLFLTTSIISFMPQNNQRLFFKVPFLPWLPVFAIFLNIYIMFGLNHLTWIRFGVWMAVGFIVYFGYGCRHSVQRELFDDGISVDEPSFHPEDKDLFQDDATQ
ncbi:high affinity cationic amino acid transporter 1-like [Hydractinia symbiolongicarpus]|uniref:high affinity cationic amino acid transporter 1-like n=1 Tax=Hydractinia symbiolongicarpus TaxID=13093 RepID=UPI002549C8C5|nr:high affinity cationic amino acid transporter 1-like [Hydractinia symbiolongicarpus]